MSKMPRETQSKKHVAILMWSKTTGNGRKLKRKLDQFQMISNFHTVSIEISYGKQCRSNLEY